MGFGLKVGWKYQLKENAPSKRGLQTGETVTYVRSEGGGKIKDELMPIFYIFKKANGEEWRWSGSVGELLSGWLEEIK